MACYFYLAYSNPDCIPFYSCCVPYNVLHKGDKIKISQVLYEVVDVSYDYDRFSNDGSPSVDIIVKPNTKVLF